MSNLENRLSSVERKRVGRVLSEVGTRLDALVPQSDFTCEAIVAVGGNGKRAQVSRMPIPILVEMLTNNGIDVPDFEQPLGLRVFVIVGDILWAQVIPLALISRCHS
mgnify:CR=1 FL=1